MKLVGRTDVADALLQLDKLTQEEVRMVAAQNLKATHGVDDKVTALGSKMCGVDDRLSGVDDRLSGVEDSVRRVEDSMKGVKGNVKRVLNSA
jgi:archaellum component FlaC